MPLVHRVRSFPRAVMLLLILSLTSWNLYLRWKWHEEMGEVERLRGELGVLTIDDPNRFYVREMPTSEPLSWRWRIYVPPGERVLHIGAGRISETGTRVGAGAGLGPGRRTHKGVTTDPMQGEYTLTVRVERDQLGKWRLVVRYRDGSLAQSIMPQDADWLLSGDNYYEVASRWKTNAEVAGSDQHTQTFAADDTVVLLRLRAPDEKQAASNEPSDGVMVWFEKHALPKQKEGQPKFAPNRTRPATKRPVGS